MIESEADRKVRIINEAIEKRYPSPGWLVLTEVSSNTWSNRRYADGMALGCWRSNKYEAHGFEIKIERRDVIRELKKPEKSGAIGKYCHYWWLVLWSEDLIKDLIIPDEWGILALDARHQLRVVRKGPKDPDAKPFDAHFVISCIRNVTSKWVSPIEHQHVKEATSDKLREELRRELKAERDDNAIHLRRMRDAVAAFEAASGVKLLDEEERAPAYASEIADIGHVVRLVVEMRKSGRYTSKDPTSIIEHEIEDVERRLQRAKVVEGALWQVKQDLEAILARERQRQTSGLDHPDARATAADGVDDAGGRGHRGDAGAPEQDAGLQLRDLGAEVPHGQQAP